jgi:hypothetical protein
MLCSGTQEVQISTTQYSRTNRTSRSNAEKLQTLCTELPSIFEAKAPHFVELCFSLLQEISDLQTPGSIHLGPVTAVNSGWFNFCPSSNLSNLSCAERVQRVQRVQAFKGSNIFLSMQENIRWCPSVLGHKELQAKPSAHVLTRHQGRKAEFESTFLNISQQVNM